MKKRKGRLSARQRELANGVPMFGLRTPLTWAIWRARREYDRGDKWRSAGGGFWSRVIEIAEAYR